MITEEEDQDTIYIKRGKGYLKRRRALCIEIILQDDSRCPRIGVSFLAPFCLRQSGLDHSLTGAARTEGFIPFDNRTLKKSAQSFREVACLARGKRIATIVHEGDANNNLTDRLFGDDRCNRLDNFARVGEEAEGGGDHADFVGDRRTDPNCSVIDCKDAHNRDRKKRSGPWRLPRAATHAYDANVQRSRLAIEPPLGTGTASVDTVDCLRRIETDVEELNHRIEPNVCRSVIGETKSEIDLGSAC